jgi:hypothetical protein
VCGSVAAADDGEQVEKGAAPAHFELWSGAQGYRQVWSIYSGVSTAPFGSIQEDGLRIRVIGGYGADSYSGSPPAGGPGQVTYKGTTSFADALVGYHRQLGPLTLKLFGVSQWPTARSARTIRLRASMGPVSAVRSQSRAG